MARGFWEHIHPPHLHPLRAQVRHTFCLGGLALWAFLVLAASGAVLMFHYAPTPAGAAGFFSQESGGLPFLWFFRRAHFLAGQAMMILVLAHMVRVLATGAYLPPRASNWLVGLGLLLLTLFMDFSGYLLRWDGPTRAAATVVGGLLEQVPVLGPFFSRLLLAGPSPQAASLLRFYVLHCLALPALAFLLMGYHFWRIRKDGRAMGGL